MKIKLPITENFFWGIYEIFELMGQIEEIFGPRSLKEAVCSDIRHIRYEARRKYGRQNFSKLMYYLKKNGYIKTPDWDPKGAIIITPKGLEKMFYVKLKAFKKKRRPDGKWEMVVFDIPEKRRGLRDEIRVYLKKLGYKQFQQSIWISPFDVLQETQILVNRYNLENEIKIFIIEKP